MDYYFLDTDRRRYTYYIGKHKVKQEISRYLYAGKQIKVEPRLGRSEHQAQGRVSNTQDVGDATA